MIKSIIYWLLIPVLITVTACTKTHMAAPILILSSEHHFGFYTEELLRAEGFNEFITDSLSNPGFSLKYLEKFSIVIIPGQPVSEKQKVVFDKYVRDGGHLIAFSPDRSLCGIFGIIPLGETIEDPVMVIDTETYEGKGLHGEAISIHTLAERYAVDGANVIACLYDGPTTGERFPAVVSNAFGKGCAMAFLYHLPENIVYSRQGNPAFAGLEKDGIPGLRAMDLFTDGWVDTTVTAFNTTDEQMHLLAGGIETMQSSAMPLPRFWYFPDTLGCLVTLTNDGEVSGEQDFEEQFREVDSMHAGMSLYILETGKVSKVWADRWAGKGFEISGHPDDTPEATSPTWDSMSEALRLKKGQIKQKYGQTMRTVANHWFVWCGKDTAGLPDFSAQADIEVRNGIQLDANYAHYDNFSNSGHFLGPMGYKQGNFTGSGLVMKFASARGTMDIYQMLTNVYDQEYMENRDAKGYFDCFRGLMDRSIEDGIYSYISIKAHNNEYYFSRIPLMHMLEYAGEKHIPVWTVKELLDFMLMKDEASFHDISRMKNEVRFTVVSSRSSSGRLTFMIPMALDSLKLTSILVDENEKDFTVRKIRDIEYALAAVVPGNSYRITVRYR